MAPVRDELASRQYLTGPKLAERVDGEISEPATVLPEAELGRAARFVESGEKQSVTGDWKLAVAELARGVDLLLSAPVSMAQRQDLRDLLFAGLVALARAEARLGASEEATRWMAELLRTFPERELSRAKYPPDVHKLYREVQDQLASDGLGRLTVKTDSGVMVFVNERFVGLGEVDLGALPSGVYRVYLQRGDRRGRLHRVDVGSASDETLAIRWTLDGALRTDGGRVRFEFDGETERAELEAASTVEVARAVNASTVAVVGIREHDGRRAIIGSVLSMETGKSLRSAVIAVEPVAPSDEKIRALGRFLAGDTEAARLLGDARIDGAPSVGPAPARRTEIPAWYADKLGWVLAGGGLIVAGAGAGFLASASSLESQADRESDSDERQRLRDDASGRRKIGVVLAVTGAVVLVGGIVRLALHPKQAAPSRPGVEVGFGLGSIVVQGRF